MKIKYLHQLISSLSKGEKRQLSVSPKRQGKESLGLQLYTYLNRKKKYDQHTDKKVNEILANTSRPDQVMTNLAADISLSLSIQNTYSQSTQVYKFLLEAEFYNYKELYEPMLKTLKKARKITLDYELFPLHLRTLDVAITHYGINTKTTINNPLSDLRLERTEVIKKINNYEAYKETYNSLLTSFRQSHNQKDLSEFDKIANSPLLADISNALSVKAKSHYYKSHMMITHLKVDHAKGLRYSLDFLNLLAAHPHFIKKNKYNFIATNHYYLAKCIELKEFDGLEEKIEAVLNIPTDNKKEEKFKYQLLIPMVLEFYNLPSQDKKRLDDYLPSFEQFFHKNHNELSQLSRIIISAEISRTYFLLNNMDSAKRWLHLQKDNHPKGLRVDLKIFSRVLEQLIDLEEGLFFLVKSRTPGIKIALENNEQYGKMEKTILQFLTKYSNLQESQQFEKVPTESFIAVLEELKSKLKSIPKEKRDNSFLQYLDYEYWADKKIRKLQTQMGEMAH